MAETCTQTSCFAGQNAVETMKAAFLASPQNVKTQYADPVRKVHEMEGQLRAAASKPPTGYCCAWKRLGDSALTVRAAIINASLPPAPTLPESAFPWGTVGIVVGSLAVLGAIVGAFTIRSPDHTSVGRAHRRSKKGN
jgi:hypothetical protein